MNPQDPLAELRDIQLPATGGWWPPAPGWWLVAVLVIITAILALLFWRRHRLNTLWKRQARAELARLADNARQQADWFSELNQLLKRVARKAFPARHPEALTGSQWLEFLLDTCPSDRVASRPVAEALVAAPWRPQPELEPSQALAFARFWLEAQL